MHDSITRQSPPLTRRARIYCSHQRTVALKNEVDQDRVPSCVTVIPERLMLTLVSFLLFTILLAVVSWWKTHDDRQDTADGYFLAGRSLTWPVIGGSLLLTSISTEQLVGINGGAYQYGMLLMTWEVWSSRSIGVCGVVLA